MAPSGNFEQLNVTTQAVLDSLGQGILFFNREGICAPVFSRACLTLLEGDPAGRHIYDVLRLDVSERGRFGDFFDLLFAPAPAAPIYEQLLTLAPQAYAHSGGLHVSLVYKPMYDGQGAVSCILLIAADRTAEREAREKQRQQDEQLRHAQKMDAVGQLTSGIAHDFNNILSIILGSTRLLKKRLTVVSNNSGTASNNSGAAGGTVPVENKGLTEKVADIEAAAWKGAELVRNLMVFTRQRELKRETVDINTCVTRTVALLKSSLGALVECRMYLADEAWPVQLDTGQFEFALLNIAVNARDAMPKGGTVTFETRNVTLDEEHVSGTSGALSGDFVMISVTDTGTGMEESVQERIFEPFFTTKALGEGTGLGLSQVYGFVRQARGHIVVESAPDRGTVFRLYFPRQGVAAQANDEETEADSFLPNGSETVLIVEDDRDMRAVSIRMLQRLGYNTLTAESGEKALEVLKRHAANIDLVFVDVIIPGGMSGIEFVQQARGCSPGVGVLYTSGYARNALPDYYLLSGDVLVSKPFTKEGLARKVREAMNAKEKQRAR